MAPTPSKLLRLSVHASACRLTCVCCWERVRCINASGGGKTPDPKCSQQLNKFLSDLALVRWGLLWDYSQTSSDAVYPMRLCLTCRLALILGEERRKRLPNVLKVSREHSQEHVWRPGQCRICDKAFARGRPKTKGGRERRKRNVFSANLWTPSDQWARERCFTQ